MSKRILSAFLTAALLLAFPSFAYAHSGRTDSDGGHRNHSTGKYHYHHGYSAHNHDKDGTCPILYDDGYDAGYEKKYSSGHRVGYKAGCRAAAADILPIPLTILGSILAVLTLSTICLTHIQRKLDVQ